MKKAQEQKRFDFVDVTLRDAHQCLWSTRMTTAMMTPIAPDSKRYMAQPRSGFFSPRTLSVCA